MKRVLGVLVGAAVALAAGGAGAAYQVVEVKDGGSISGTVKVSGTAPAAKAIEVTKDKEVCGKSGKLVEEALVVGPKGGIQYAVVSVTGIAKGKKWASEKFTFDQKNCRFDPHVLVVKAGTSVDILNSDGILHNIHTFSEKNAAFNVAMPKFKKKLEKAFAAPEMIRVACDAHSWMSGWIVVSESPYTVVTDADGSFKLGDVPPGTYKVEIWHEKLGKVTKEVTVKAKEDTKLGVELSAK
jgi:plastocyanin